MLDTLHSPAPWKPSLMDDPDVFIYTTRQVADAARVLQPTLDKWVTAGSVALSAAWRNPGTGRSRWWSLRQVYQVAIAAELHRRGMPPAVGSELALHFTDLGDSDREPGTLYPRDKTLLVVTGPADKPEAEVLPLSSADIGSMVDAGDKSLLIINLSRLVTDCRLALGLPAQL
jgi:hypothetical protein